MLVDVVVKLTTCHKLRHNVNRLGNPHHFGCGITQEVIVILPINPIMHRYNANISLNQINLMTTRKTSANTVNGGVDITLAGEKTDGEQ